MDENNAIQNIKVAINTALLKGCFDLEATNHILASIVILEKLISEKNATQTTHKT